jgi:propionate CoA-transferase
MDFLPLVSPDLKTMDERLFREAPMGISSNFEGRSRAVHPRLSGSVASAS